VTIATEDELSESVAVRLVNSVFGDGRIGHPPLGRKGNGYLKKRLPNFRQMAKREIVLVLTDLDDSDCAPSLLEKWADGQAFPENLLVRVAVREIEAWLLSDRNGMANLLGISPNKIPLDVESLGDPKRFLLNLARNAKREVRSELIVAKGAAASQGLGYNRLLSAFAATNWQLEDAINSSASLSKAVFRLREAAGRTI
jgi:hypothetical protein